MLYLVSGEKRREREASMANVGWTDDEKLAAAEALDRAYAEADAYDRKAREHRVDLKWSLWSARVGCWEEYAPETLALLRAGIEGGHMLEDGWNCVIHTAPRKEIRCGTVEIYARDGRIFADVLFGCEWDEPYALAGTLLAVSRLEETDENLARVQAYVEDCGIRGTTREETIDFGETPTLAEVLEKIDAVESALLADDTAEWEATVESVREMFEPAD